MKNGASNSFWNRECVCAVYWHKNVLKRSNRGRRYLQGGFFFFSINYFLLETVHTVAVLFSIYSILNNNKSYCPQLSFLCFIMSWFLSAPLDDSPSVSRSSLLPLLHWNAFGSVFLPPKSLKVYFGGTSSVFNLLSLAHLYSCIFLDIRWVFIGHTCGSVPTLNSGVQRWVCSHDESQRNRVTAIVISMFPWTSYCDPAKLEDFFQSVSLPLFFSPPLPPGRVAKVSVIWCQGQRPWSRHRQAFRLALWPLSVFVANERRNGDLRWGFRRFHPDSHQPRLWFFFQHLYVEINIVTYPNHL